MDRRRLRVVVVSEDRGVLRHMSQFLNVFGFTVRQAADVQQALAAMECTVPDILIVDGRLAGHGGLQLCRSASHRDLPHYVYKFVILGDAETQVVAEALEAGADDFLARPLVHGEVLVRLRAAARAVEFERRVRLQASREPLTGCLSRSQVVDRLGRELDRGADEGRSTACVVLDVDSFGRINVQYGRPTGDRILRDLVATLEVLCGQGDVMGCCGGARFGVILPGRDQQEAVGWAGRAREAIEQVEASVGDATLWLTASFGVASSSGGVDNAGRVFGAAESALKLAKWSGRNCIVHEGQFDGETKAWEELAAPGKLFERTTARDVMVPVTVVLSPDDPLSRAESIFRNAHLAAVPVVDRDGQLAGLLSATDVVPAAAGSVADLMSSDVTSLDESTSFETLMEHLNRDATVLVIVAGAGRPTGIVSAGQLASISEPITTMTFSPAIDYAASSDFLLIEDTSS